MRSIYKAFLPAVAAAFAFAAVTAIAQPSPAVKEDKAQMKSDKVELQHDEKQMKADTKAMKSDKASGKTAAESKDSEKHDPLMDRRGRKTLPSLRSAVVG